MNCHFIRSRPLIVMSAAFVFATLPNLAHAAGRDRQITLQAADPNEQGDGTMSAVARQAMTLGALPKSAAEVAAKGAITAAARQAQSSGPLGAEQFAPAGGPDSGPLALSIVRNFRGIFQVHAAPSDSTGAVGRTRYIELINTNFAIYNKTTDTPLSTGTLNQLAGLAASAFTINPQIIWDAQTNRFYYVALSIFSATDNRLSFGFSKTGSPDNGTSDWCHYTFPYGSELPDSPKLGDSRHFIIIGVNGFVGSTFGGADIIGISKPPAGTTCPAAASFKTGVKFTLMGGGTMALSPVPANEIDVNATGYVVARNGALPSNRLWFFNVTRGADGRPAFGNGRGLAVPSYTYPPDVPAGAGTGRFLSTLDARNTQAVMAINPARGATAVSFWTQHTIAGEARSIVRLYEIDPVPTMPALRQTRTIASTTPGVNYFNAAISPDRVVDGATKKFGRSFGVGYSVTQGGPDGINPRIVVTTSRNGTGFVSKTVQSSDGPYSGFDCATSISTCRWGSYSAATPDPTPGTTGAGKIWFTNMFASGGQATDRANWRTRNWAVTP